jgi:AAA+ ATPase superfamily predicted ATPase
MMNVIKSIDQNEKPFYGRVNELSEIRNFITKNESNLAYFKGRRRVGKSFILKKIQKEYGKRCIYFSGSADETDAKCRARFKEKLAYVFDISLLDSVPNMSWSKMFTIISENIKNNPNDKLCLFFDEIQWIAKS